MTDEIIAGFDCCRDYEHPERPPRIYPRKITMGLGEAINLYLRVVHPDCYESCYTWKILSGGGFLDPEVGIQTYYHAPSENEICKMNPVIECRCPRGRIEKIYIAAGGLPGTEVAFYTAGAWRDKTLVVDGKIAKFTPPPEWYKGTTPKYAAIDIRARYCDGSTHYRHLMSLIQDSAHGPGDTRVLSPNRFRHAFVAEGNLQLGREIGPTFELAKEWLIDNQINPFATKKLKTDYTWLQWIPTFPALLLHPPIKPGGILDVRSLGQLEKGCCHYDLILEE